MANRIIAPKYLPTVRLLVSSDFYGLRQHREFAWQQPILRDMPSRGWTTFSVR